MRALCRRVHVRRRPHLGAFLQRCAELFEVVVFTASQKVYAEQLLNILDPSRCAALRCAVLCCPAPRHGRALLLLGLAGSGLGFLQGLRFRVWSRCPGWPWCP